MRIIKVYIYSIVAVIISFACHHAQAQVSSLQQPPVTQNGNTSNILEKLFANPAANGAFANINAVPNADSAYNSIKGVPRFQNSFWGGLFNKQLVDAGTVLNGTLEDDLSSKSSKVGDTFSILLLDGYTLNNVQLIPLNARIVGVVSAATPASHQNNGVAGSIQISLQALVLPDGTSMPIIANVMYNPNQPSKIDIKKGRGIPIGEYASAIEYSVVQAAGSLTRQVGLPLPYKTQTSGGPDFFLKKGQLLPVKLIQPLDMTAFVNSHALQNNQITNQSANQTLNQSPNQVPNTGLLNGSAPNMLLEPMAPSNTNQNFGFNGIPPSQSTFNQNTPNSTGWPGGMPNSFSNTLPGNTSPAGPEPF